MNKQELKIEVAGSHITLETGRMAKQADGAIFATCGGTQVLATVCSAHSVKDGQDFFPLLVDYSEKFYAAGKFLGGFRKREGRPGDHEVLNSRLIDRPLRPLFPSDYMFETIVMLQVLSYDGENDPETLAGTAASAAICLSDIPFNGPIGMCKVGRINGELVFNPKIDQWKDSDLEIAVAASADAILMVEGELDEVSEADTLEALKFAHDNIKTICHSVKEFQSKVGRPKREYVSAEVNDSIFKVVEEKFQTQAREVLSITEKQKRSSALKGLTEAVSVDMKENYSSYTMEENDNFSKEAYKAVDDLMYKMMRTDILESDKRIGNRALDEVRQITTEIDVLSRVHGSSLFTRGETQVLAAVTLGGPEGNQKVDKLIGSHEQDFYLHYSFPPYSVGEARGYRGVGRRELGHGNLAERAVKKLIPSNDDFPYTIRVNCEVLESNGSSSMGSVCSASMALMDAGVPLKSPVAGIAMGLVKEEENYKILTDILGDEDHLGDMDFKVAGTKDGICSIQMDIKITGITAEIIEKSLTQAKEGRLTILNEMEKTISERRDEMKSFVPKVESLEIDKDKIGALIGPGGKNIKKIQERFEVEISIEETGMVRVKGSNGPKLKECLSSINLQINGPELNSDYSAVVVSVKEYGAFVDIAEGVSGLLHVSEIAEKRIKDVNEYLKEGDELTVRVIGIDNYGKIKLSAKAVKPLEAKYA